MSLPSSDRSGWGCLFVAAPVALVAFVILAFVALFGLRGPVATSRGGAPTASRTAQPVAVTTTAAPAGLGDANLDLDAERSELRPPVLLGRDVDGAVLDIRGRGFEPDASGTVAFCAGPRGRCSAAYPVRSDDAGRVRALYRLPTEVQDGAAVVVSVGDLRASAVVGSRPAVRAALAAADGPLRLEVSGAPPGQGLEVRRCEPEAEALRDCVPVERLTADRFGRAALAADGHPASASLIVVDESGIALTDPLVVPRRAADVAIHLDPRRLAVGSGVAAILLLVAIQLVRTTDWRVPSEAEVRW